MRTKPLLVETHPWIEFKLHAFWGLCTRWTWKVLPPPIMAKSTPTTHWIGSAPITGWDRRWEKFSKSLQIRLNFWRSGIVTQINQSFIKSGSLYRVLSPSKTWLWRSTALIYSSGDILLLGCSYINVGSSWFNGSSLSSKPNMLNIFATFPLNLVNIAGT
jgi:hypothetical protein